MTLKEFYMDCLYYEEHILVYYIQHLLSENKISLEDDVSKLDFNQADQDKVAELIRKNPLGFRKIYVFELKVDGGGVVYIFAANEQDAINLFKRTFRKAPIELDYCPLDTEIIVGNKVMTFRELKRTYNHFPTFISFG